MARKKADAPPDDVPMAEPVNGTATELPPAATVIEERKKPVVSWRYPAAQGVTIEVALWANTITLQSGEQADVLNAAITRSYRDKENVWRHGGSYRASELPVLMHALAKAHAYVLDTREMNVSL